MDEKLLLLIAIVCGVLWVIIMIIIALAGGFSKTQFEKDNEAWNTKTMTEKENSTYQYILMHRGKECADTWRKEQTTYK